MEGKVVSIADVNVSAKGWATTRVETTEHEGSFFIGKEGTPVPFKVGDTIQYEYKNDPQYGGKIELIKQQNGFGGGKKGFTPEPFEHKCAGYAAAYSKDLVVAGKIDIKDIATYADKFYNWMITKKQG